MSTPIKRRFIAGAVCPECKQQDKIVTYRIEEDYIYECVSCGHSEKINDTTATPPATPQAPPQPAPENDTQIVRLIDPDSHE